MTVNRMATEILILSGVSVMVALAVNYVSPKGIAWVGQWDEAKGVISARAKDDGVLPDLEIGDVKVAKQIFDQGKALFVDARSQDRFEEGHIQGAVSLPVNRFDAMIEAFQKRYPPSQPMVTYCSGRSCDDSHRLAQLLFASGFKKVSVMIDGFPGWAAAGYPVE